jgi:hypothetical protein
MIKSKVLIILLIFICVLFLCILNILTIEYSIIIKNPGVAWKVKYSDYPELLLIYSKYKEYCSVIPTIPIEYNDELLNNETYQTIRNDCKYMTNEIIENKYDTFERDGKINSEWFFNVSHMLNDNNYQGYKPRLGCFIHNISLELETFATDQINKLMSRLQLTNKLKRLSDSRGSTYMPPGGCMEVHSNRDHLGGWRLYMHVVDECKGDSWFNYRHPFDNSIKIIKDVNDKANMFRIRKPPKQLLWHSIWSNTDRFSWGIWLPPELAQKLKENSDRI